MTLRGAGEARVFEHLGRQACWDLVGSRVQGRLGFASGDHVAMAPASYRVDGQIVYLRASTFGPVARHTHDRPTVLQVDEIDPKSLVGWAVLMTGSSRLVVDAATLANLWSPTRPASWAASSESVWIALDVDEIQGERITSSTRIGRRSACTHPARDRKEHTCSYTTRPRH